MFATPFQPATNSVTTVPSPIGGLNARDSLAAMPETDAIVMNNWWPQPYGCIIRKGYQKWSSGLGGPVNTLAVWSSASGTRKLFGWAGANMFDCTARAPVGAALVAGLSNSTWQSTNITNLAGGHLIAVNGVDDGILYNAAGVARIVAGDGIVVHTWAGLDPKKAIQLTVHQSRLWAVEKDTSIGWFLPPNAIQGTFVSYDFGGLWGRGGGLEYLTTWTLDDGNGAEDHLIAMSSRGEAAVFGGTDPTDDTKWQLVGVYYVGAPVSGRRSFVKAAGDLLCLTQQGLVSMGAELVSTKVNEQDDPITSRKIQFLISNLISESSTLAGWTVQYFPKINQVLINVPSVVDGANIQLAANQIIGSWTQFTGMDAATWQSYDSNPYFGDYAGNIWYAWVGELDKVGIDGTGGVGILAQVQQAYSYLKAFASQKQVGMYSPVLIVSAPTKISSEIQYDFTTDAVQAPDGTVVGTGALWNTARWNQDTWSGGGSVQHRWIQASGMGVAMSLRLATQTQTEVLWVSTNYSVLKGDGIL